MPLIADIHFDHRLALASVDAGVDALRINPGNIGETWKVDSVEFASPPVVGRKTGPKGGPPRALHGLEAVRPTP